MEPVVVAACPVDQLLAFRSSLTVAKMKHQQQGATAGGDPTLVLGLRSYMKLLSMDTRTWGHFAAEFMYICGIPHASGAMRLHLGAALDTDAVARGSRSPPLGHFSLESVVIRVPVSAFVFPHLPKGVPGWVSTPPGTCPNGWVANYLDPSLKAGPTVTKSPAKRRRRRR